MDENADEHDWDDDDYDEWWEEGEDGKSSAPIYSFCSRLFNKQEEIELLRCCSNKRLRRAMDLENCEFLDFGSG